MMNGLNLELQGKQKLINEQYNNVKSFIELLDILISQVPKKNFIKFAELTKLTEVVKLKISKKQLDKMKTFLVDLQEHMKQRFKYIEKSNVIFEFVNFPFVDGNVAEISENLILNLFQVSSIDDLNVKGKVFLKDLDTELLRFRTFKKEWMLIQSTSSNLQEVWIVFAKKCDMKSFPLLAEIVAKVLSLFGSSWWNESGFSIMKAIKSKFRVNLSEKNLDNCMRIATYDDKVDLVKVMKHKRVHDDLNQEIDDETAEDEYPDD